MARIALVDCWSANRWRQAGNRFEGLARVLRSAGHETHLFLQSPEPLEQSASFEKTAALPTLLTALNRADATHALVSSHQLAMRLVELSPDLVIAPLAGGVAQGVLSARACGEAYAGVRVALWCDDAEAVDSHDSDATTASVAPLIADALERQCIVLADALLVPLGRDDIEAAVEALGGATRPCPDLPRKSASPPDNFAPAAAIKELTFVGPFNQNNGGAEFVHVVEELARTGLLQGRTVAFLGPMADEALGLSKAWLGLRAAHWDFAFKVDSNIAPDAARRYLADPSRLGVMIGCLPDEHAFLADCGARHVTVRFLPRERASIFSRTLEQVRAALLGGEQSRELVRDADAGRWRSVVDDLLRLPQSSMGEPRCSGVSVCILHRDRPALLQRAIASVPEHVSGAPVELVVVDNASRQVGMSAAIREMAGAGRHLKLVELADPEPFARAHNRGLAAASHDVVVFHDDDNVFMDGGVARFARAIEHGRFDVVVTPLEVFDDVRAHADQIAGRLIFLGAAHSAGLFFNAFGDTSMAVRRESFLRLGGFYDAGYPYPCADWVTLALAQSRGLRIGSLQWPAVRYRRDSHRADLSAQKLDQEGARSLVREAYAGAFDATLVARIAQAQHLLDW